MLQLVEATSCTRCGSTDIRTKRKYTRSVRTLHGIETVEVTQHCCRKCEKTFTDEIKGVKYNIQIADEVKDRAVDLYMEGPDIGCVRKVMEKFGIKISIGSIWNRINALGKLAVKAYDKIIGMVKPSEYVCIDEKFVSVNGKKRPFIFVIDPNTGIPLFKKLLRNREESTIIAVLKVIKRMGVRVVCTDDLKSYAPALKKLGMRHHKCHFHAKYTFSRKMKSAHIQKKRKAKFIKWCHNFIDAKNRKEAIARKRVLGRLNKEKKLKRFMKSFLFDWPDYFTYLEFDGCPKTTNPVEQYNRRFEQKRQTMHGLRKERTARDFIALFSLHSIFRKFEEGKNKGISPMELAGVQLGTMDMFAFLNQ